MEPNEIKDNKEEDEEIGLVSIVKSTLFSIKYGKKENEYDRLFDCYNDIDYVRCFFKENEKYLYNEEWRKVANAESATRQVLFEAKELEDRLQDYAKNSLAGKKPDLDSMFHYIGGNEFSNFYEFVPVKAYGYGRPAFLRFYAVKLGPNRYVITGGGIKLDDTIQSSPGLKEHVLQNIRRVIEWFENSKDIY